MSTQKNFRPAAALIIVLLVSLSSSAASAQNRHGAGGGKSDKAKAKAPKPAPTGTPVLWREPIDIESRDLLLGPGGEAMKPDLSRVTFVKEETGGWSKKYRVSDGAGRTWVAKIGPEAQSETAAVRLVWAVGYPTEINYLVPRLTIQGKGTFENVRLEARPEEVDRLEIWKWAENPFVGKKELQGLLVLNALLNNWDLKDENNKVMHVVEDGRSELLYVISDLGATFGKTGSGPLWQLKRSRNKPVDYAKSNFVDEVKNNNVFFSSGGKGQKLFDDIRVEEARWIGGWLARLSDRQLQDAFRAANYAPADVELLARSVRSRVNELVNLPAAGNVGAR